MLELYILLIFMIICAVVAIEVEDLLSSVVMMGGMGLVVCIAYLVLRAPDLAITQLVVEVLCLAILIRATLKKDLPFSTSGRWYINTTIAVVFVLSFLLVACRAFRDLPVFGSPLMRVSAAYLKDGLTLTGATNLVSAIVLDFRAYDTLGEATVLFAAVIGVMAIVRRVGRKKAGEQIAEEQDE